jgi:Tol biopolymer transport system component
MTGQLKVVLLVIFTMAAQASSAGESLFTARTGGTGCIVEELSGSDDARFHVQGVSRDGKWLSYTEEYGQADDGKPIRTIFLLNLDSGHKKAMHDTITNSGAFSPDGHHLVAAFEVESDRTDIWEINLETQELIPIAQHEQWDWLPSYSPDGSSIVFNSWRIDDQSEIYSYDRASGELTRMTNNPRYDAHGEYSPDGTKILFHRMVEQKDQGGYDFELFVIDVETGEEKQITPGSPFEESYASWAPDSKHVVFSSDHDGKPEKHNLYILGPDGEIVSRLTRGDWKDSYAYWSRDGKYIYFTSERGGKPNVYRVPMVGLNCKKAD